MTLTATQRRELILDQVYARGHVAIRDLALEMEVSEATVRRDLRSLADEKRIDLVYGGATVPSSRAVSIEDKALRNMEGKRTIGNLAAALVNDGDMVFIDSGTTAFEMRHRLLQMRDLTVITNSLAVANELGVSNQITVIQIGGQFRPDRMDTTGPLAEQMIDKLRGYVAFLGADGLSAEFGVSASDIQTASLHQHIHRHARETVLLADYTKFHAPSLFRIAELDAVHRIVTDRRPTQEWVDLLAALGIDLTYPDSGDDAPALDAKEAAHA